MLKDFIALTCIYDPRKPFTVYIRASAIEVASYHERDGYTVVNVPSHRNGGYKVSETPEQVLAKIAEADGIVPDRQLARLLHAVWDPAHAYGEVSVDKVAAFLQCSPAAVKQIYVRAKQLAKEAT